MSAPDPWSGAPATAPVGGAISPSPLAAPPLLMGIPNVSEGRDPAIIDVIGQAYVAAGAALLTTHQDVDHHRSVHTLAAPQGVLARALAAGAAAAIEHIDLTTGRGLHPHVGALDVCPVVFLDEDRAGAAVAEALLTAQLVGELGVPVLLYGELAGGRTRAFLRRGGTPELIRRVRAGELKPDFGPATIDPRHGAVLVAARPPLVAFNLELEPPATVDDATRIAALIREGGDEGLPGLRAIGLGLEQQSGIAQVSCNVEDHRAVPLARLAEAVGRHARVRRCELVGLLPKAALDGFPDDLEIINLATIEDALAGAGLPQPV